MKEITYPLPIGTKLKSQNEYTITEVLGQGGFGITYIATADVKVGNITVKGARFAIKEFFLLEKCKRADDGISLIPMDKSLSEEVEECLEDFLTEGRRINKLCHADEHIVNVNEVFTANNTAYFVMEYLDAGNLDRYVERKGKLSGKEAKEILIPIAKAIGKMHKERILHLDIKPENIMMKKLDDGTLSPVIIDFGIAMHFNKQGKATTNSKNKSVSVGYSPIEQYGKIDSFMPNIDVYALGATLFFMLTGEEPRQAFDVTPEYLEDSLKGTDDILKSAVTHAMAKEVVSRTESAEAFIEELGRKKKEVVRKPTERISAKKPKGNTVLLTEEDGSQSDKIKTFTKPLVAVILVGALAIGAALILPGQCSKEDVTITTNDSTNKDSVVVESDSLTAKEPIQDTIVHESAEPITQPPSPTIESNTQKADDERLAKEKQDAQAKTEAQKKAEEQAAKAKAEAQRKAEEQAAKAKIEAQKQAEEQKARNAKIQNKVNQAYSAAHSGDAATAKRLVNEITAEGGEWRSKGQAMRNEFKALGVYDFD